MEKPKYLADAAKIANEITEADERTIQDPILRTAFEAGYALLRAARQYNYELPFDDSDSSYPIVLQCGLEKVSGALVHKEKDPEKISQIYNLAMNIVAVNHPEYREEEQSEAGKHLRFYKGVTITVLQEIEQRDAVDFVTNYLFDKNEKQE